MSKQTAEERIRHLLSDIEHRTGAQVLYAIESGSRAWGFESPNSDYDVRFIYREPPKVAFGFNRSRDVIEETHLLDPDTPGSVPIDMVGWRLEKAIRLGLSSNPQIAEWSTITSHYVVDADFHAQMKYLASHSSPRALAHHYRGLATKTLMTYLKGEDDPVGKKYLYAIRPILAARWMIEHPHVGVTPPVLFSDLRQQVAVPELISQEIDTLLAWKVAQDEERGQRRFPLLDQWIVESIKALPAAILDLKDPWIEESVGEEIWEKQYPEIFDSQTDIQNDEVRRPGI